MASLSKGAKGKPVTQLQKALNKNGTKPKLKEDGIFGPITDAAVRAYQKKNKMKVDGIVGPNSSFALSIGPRPKSLQWPIDFDPAKEMKAFEKDVKETDANFKKYVGILKKALADNDNVKKALMERAKMLSDRKKIVGTVTKTLLEDAKELQRLQEESEKSTDFAKIKDIYDFAEKIYKNMDNAAVDEAVKNLDAFDETVKDIEEYQEGVAALKSKLKSS